ncbi:hypothetical protein CGS69_03260 [Salmonella enterica subsp. enterica serovar Montevideo]|nr:hypothetical protein [Salmonella enterica subsp. enterica serovar Montevideo]
MGSCAAPSAKGDDKFITTDYLQQCLLIWSALIDRHRARIFIREGKQCLPPADFTDSSRPGV